MGASGTGPRKTKFEPQMPGFVKVFPPTFYRDRFATWEEANRFAAQSFEDVIIQEDPDTVAGGTVQPNRKTSGHITPYRGALPIFLRPFDRHKRGHVFHRGFNLLSN